MTNTTCPRPLKSRYSEGRVIPFVGAGVPLSVTWTSSDGEARGPSWKELVDRAVDQLGFDRPELARVRGTDLQILEYFKIRNSGEIAKLTNWLTKHMTPPNEVIRGASILSELVKLDNCRKFYTTNYDDFLERAFRLAKRKHEVVAVEAEMGVSFDATEIVKFHGDLDHPKAIVLTESDYERRLKQSTSLDRKLHADLLGRVVLFVGYSFRDPNVSYLFRLFQDGLASEFGTLSGPRAYIALPDPSDFEYTLFQDRKIEVIPLNGSAHTQSVADLIRDMRT